MYDVITFDCYGTLVDWEGGISGAIVEAARKHGHHIPGNEVMRAYLEVEPTIQATEYRSYRDILGEAAARTAELFGWSVTPEEAGFLAESQGLSQRLLVVACGTKLLSRHRTGMRSGNTRSLGESKR